MGKNDFAEMYSRRQHSMRKVPIPPKEEREKAEALKRQKSKGDHVDFGDDTQGITPPRQKIVGIGVAGDRTQKATQDSRKQVPVKRGPMPFSEESEKGLLCSLLRDPSILPRLPGLGISPNRFFIPVHQTIYDVLCAWDKLDESIDLVWLKEQLHKQGQLETAGGLPGLIALFNFVPTTVNIDHYIKIILEKYALRKMIQDCQQTLDQCYDHDAVPQDILTQLADATLHTSKVVTGQNGDERLTAFATATVNGPDLLSIKIPPRQVIISDWYREGDLGFVYAYRGSGKTWFVLALASALANGTKHGPWQVQNVWPVLYVDGEMMYEDNISRTKGLNDGNIPDQLHVLNHEVLYCESGLVMNFASPDDQQIILEVCLAKKIRVLILDNLGCLFTGVGEDKADEWEKVLPWLLSLRRNKISVIVVHHTGHDPSRMRGTIKREDSANWVVRLDDRRDDFSEPGARFISRFRKYRGRDTLFDYEWTFTPAGNQTIITVKEASRADVVLQWVRDGLSSCSDIAREMGLSPGTVSKLATRLIKEGKLTKTKGRGYEVAE
jgi:hypothetical protein